jgi:tripeptidyl-peptidase-1
MNAANFSKSYCTYTAYGETGDDPNIDPVYPDPQAGGYKGKHLIAPIPIMLIHKGQLQCGVYKPTNVISASYGQAESDLPIGYTKRQCNEFMKLGLQGHSTLAASGDYGVASFAGDPEADGCLGPEGTIFNPQYPGNCPLYHLRRRHPTLSRPNGLGSRERHAC